MTKCKCCNVIRTVAPCIETVSLWIADFCLHLKEEEKKIAWIFCLYCESRHFLHRTDFGCQYLPLSRIIQADLIDLAQYGARRETKIRSNTTDRRIYNGFWYFNYGSTHWNEQHIYWNEIINRIWVREEKKCQRSVVVPSVRKLRKTKIESYLLARRIHITKTTCTKLQCSA